METLSNNRMNQFPGQQQPQVMFAHSQEDQQSGFDFWGILNRRKWIVFLGLCVGLGLGTLVHYQTPPIYESVADIRIEPKNPMAMRVTTTDLMLPDMQEILPTRHDQIIGKQVTVESCLESNGLYQLDSFEDMSKEDTIEYVLENLTVEPNKEDPYIYLVKFRTYNPTDSRTVLANIVSTYRERLEKTYKTESDRFVTLLRDVKIQFNDDYKDVLARIALVSAQDNAPKLDALGRDMNTLNIAELNKRLRAAKDELSKRIVFRGRVEEAIDGGQDEMEAMIWTLDQLDQLEINKLQEANESRIATSSILRIEETINELKMALEDESIRLGSGHHRIESIEKRLEYWKDYKARQENKLVSDENANAFEVSPEIMLRRFMLTAEADISDLQLTIESDSKELADTLANAERLAKVREKKAVLERERDQIEELLNTTKKKIVEISPSQSLSSVDQREGFRFTSLQDASFGERVWPILPILLGIGGFLGALAGFGLGCLVELADKTFHNPDEVMKQLQLPLIGHVPVISQSKRYLVEDSLIEPIICTYHRPKSQTSEAFRAVRTALFFNTQGKNHSVIQVTSPTPGDGKSTLAANLAVCIAQAGKRVLLVDGDMRRPRQHSTFGIKSSEGFATVLSGQSFWRDVVYEVEEIEGLALMPCGAKPNNPSELSTSPQVKDLVEQMREEYDFVIIDTPPILAVTDPSPIAARVDGVILCLRIKKNVKVSAERSTEVLRNLGATIVGVVVNGVGQQTGYGSQYTYGAYRAGYSYNGYGYGYGYGYGSGKYYEEEAKGGPQQPPRRIEAAVAPGQQPDPEIFEGPN